MAEKAEETLEVNNQDNKSSSTEGPDSPMHSNASSPLGDVMIPAYNTDLVEEEDGQPLLPLFSLKILEDANKDGDVVRYKLKVKKLASEDEESMLVEREYDDFEFLHHVLTTQNQVRLIYFPTLKWNSMLFTFQIIGLIVPPLPPRPAIDPHAAENRSKKQFGKNASAMLGDNFKQDAKNLERFMQQMLCHPVFGRDKHLEEFLWVKMPPIRAKIKRGFLAGMKESLDLRKTSGIKDSDDFFQKEKEWAIAYGANLKDACDAFSSAIHTQMRFANQVKWNMEIFFTKKNLTVHL